MNDFFALAARQYGTITRTQLLESGLTERQVEHRLSTATLERVHPGVYRIPGSFPSRRQRAMAAVLWCGPDALLSHATGGALLRLPVNDSVAFHVSVPRTVRRHAPGLVLHRTTVLPRSDRYVVDGLPCTSATRTIIDLATQLEAEELEHVFDSARRMGLTTKSALERRIGDARMPRSLRELLAVVDARPKESRLEVRTARLLREHGLNPEATQYVVPPYRIDFVLSVALQLGLECDGFEWHGNRLAWKRDRRRIAALEAAGWRLLHVTWDDVTLRANETISRIRQSVAARTTSATPLIHAVRDRV